MIDEEVFCLVDVENCDCVDILDFECVMDYVVVVKFYYGGKQKIMVQCLQVFEGWLLCYFFFVKLFVEIVDVFLLFNDLKELYVCVFKLVFVYFKMCEVVIVCVVWFCDMCMVIGFFVGEFWFDVVKVVEDFKWVGQG